MDALPTDRELEALKVLWQQGEASVRQVYERIIEGAASWPTRPF